MLSENFLRLISRVRCRPVSAPPVTRARDGCREHRSVTLLPSSTALNHTKRAGQCLGIPLLLLALALPTSASAEWRYEQSTGDLRWLGSPVIGPVAKGYSGAGDLKNSPDTQCIGDLGPIPRGVYRIGKPTTINAGGHLIHYALPLEPGKDTNTCGRSHFYIHGDSKTFPGWASGGCIILSRKNREEIVESGDQILRVISGKSR